MPRLTLIKSCFLIILLCLPLVKPFAAPVAKSFPLSTEIDKNDFFGNTFTLIRFHPERLTVLFERNTGSFASGLTELQINTDIPTSAVLNNYNIFLTKNDSACVTADMSILPIAESITLLGSSLVAVVIDGASIALNEFLPIAGFNGNDQGFKSATHQFRLDFNPLPTVPPGHAISRCYGQISVALEFSL
ncbi:hypothetical protein KFE26_02245 [Shewanella sp. M16]|uniref:hypothetical protein n=1 Tax=Shewanella sp. M16 TaxID=2830837 RepID=UPI001BAF4018|nr:hypothetical protein [Shewanella sp. M16]MBS0041132.1 hypothetical protein [Shewanella sp. M16]